MTKVIKWSLVFIVLASIIIGLFVVVGLLKFKSGTQTPSDSTVLMKPDIVSYYATLKQFSSSGDMRFQWYDLDQQKILNQESLFAWFFALPKNVPDDPEATAAWVKLIEANQNGVFKITGTKATPDCDYYGPDHCIENIDIQKFEIIK